MKLSKKKILLSVLLVSAISCGKFDWEPRPYVGDSETSSVFNAEGQSIRCDEPLFNTITCFDAENIAELKSAIDQVNNKKVRKKLQKKFKSLDRGQLEDSY